MKPSQKPENKDSSLKGKPKPTFDPAAALNRAIAEDEQNPKAQEYRRLMSQDKKDNTKP